LQNIVMTEPTLQAVLDAITGLDTRLTGQITALDGNLTGQITALRGDLMRRIDRLQDSFSALREDISVNFAAALRASVKAEATHAEVEALGLEVAGIHRQILRLRAEVDELRGK
jgi:predicted  nucleic acid-binding Zn-ribbon protein